ncbi:uncharacterized protein LOC134237327 [Saccostrea cucullata]|uniref:uncharacterized protein LOC134237327 n=1 Tax=Saccostrea cuccullata TaxID=36930 RepID=UPI002ED60353
MPAFGPLFHESVFASLASCTSCKSGQDIHQLKPRQRVIKRRSDKYEFYCCHCSYGADIFSDAISHVIHSHSHLKIRLGKKSEDTTGNSRSLIHIRQWDVIPHQVHSEGHIIKPNDETENLEICEQFNKSEMT